MYKTERKEQKKIIEELVNTDFSDFDKYDNMALRTWLSERTSDEGVIQLFEFISMLEALTYNWYDHSASDNLYVRKMHYQERRMAGYSSWPVGGYESIFKGYENGIKKYGGEIRLNTPVRDVVIDDKNRVRGVEIETEKKIMPNEWPRTELLEAECVICAIPVWNLFEIINPLKLPYWYVDKVNMMAKDDNRVCWLGIYAGSKEPIYQVSSRELAAWWVGPRTGLAGWAFNVNSIDEEASPKGEYLWAAGCCLDAIYAKDYQFVKRKFNELNQELEELFPQYKNTLWRMNYMVYKPSFGLIQKPGLVGINRPDNYIPGWEGLYFAGDTYKSRGMDSDRAARSGLTCAELYLGKRIPEFKDTWRY